MALQVKICGVRTPAALDAAVQGRARYVGFVFFPRSPRFVAPAQAADLARLLPTGVRSVGLLVDPDDAFLDDVTGQVSLDLLQLHGNESVQRVEQVRQRTGLPVMKAFRIGDATDLDAVPPYEAVTERLLFDARPPPGAVLPGGNGIAFDWTLLAGRTWRRPWMLAGGLHLGNLAAAVTASGARAVDVSSGVESRPGEKDPARITALLTLAATLGDTPDL